MAEAFHRNPGDQGTYGYRQLPGSGPARGPDLKTMVYATVGVALGIVAGTLAADGSWRTFSPFASQQPVRASSSVPGSPARAVNKAVPATATQAVPQPPVIPIAQQPTPANPTPVANLQAATQKSPLLSAGPSLVAANVPAAAKPAGTFAAVKASVPVPTAVRLSGARKLSASHRLRPAHRLVAGKSFLGGRRKGHGRHRLHAHLKTTVIAKAAIDTRIAPKAVAQKPVIETEVPFSFTVEGTVTVANYDSLAGIIETYEGETFALDRTSSQGRTISAVDYPPEMQYRCDQTRNCTLMHGGVLIGSARRTR